MPPADPDIKVVAASAAVGHALAEFAVALTDYVAELDPRDEPFAEDGLMPLLHISRVKAGRLLEKASDLTERPAVLEALSSGRIDEGKALMIVDQLRVLSAAHAAIAEEALLAHTATHNYTASRRYAQRFIHKLDPKAAERRYEEKRKQRRVEKTNLDDGMCSLRFLMTAFQGSLVYDRIDRIARTPPKDGRTLDQKRADVATDLLLGKETNAPQGQVRVYITMPITSLMGMNDDPAILAGYGPIPASVARDIAAGGVWKRILTDPVTGVAEDVSRRYRPPASMRDLVEARNPVCVAPGCRQPAHRCDIDHCCPFDGTNTTVANLRPKCRRHHRMKHESTWRCDNLPDGRHVWTAPAGRAGLRNRTGAHRRPRTVLAIFSCCVEAVGRRSRQNVDPVIDLPVLTGKLVPRVEHGRSGGCNGSAGR